MESFIQRCHWYCNGFPTERQVIDLWAEGIADEEKYSTLILYLMLAAYFKKGNQPAETAHSE